MSEFTPKPQPRNFSVMGIGLIVILGLVLFGIFFITNLGAPPSKTPFGPVNAAAGPEGPFNQVANDFLIALKEGQIEAAYERTAKELQQHLPLDRFRDWVKKHPFPGYPGSEGTSRREDAKRSVWVYTFWGTGPGGHLEFSFEVGKEGKEYRVTTITIAGLGADKD